MTAFPFGRLGVNVEMAVTCGVVPRTVVKRPHGPHCAKWDVWEVEGHTHLPCQAGASPPPKDPSARSCKTWSKSTAWYSSAALHRSLRKTSRPSTIQWVEATIGSKR